MEGSTEHIAGSSFQSSIRVELWIRVDLLTHQKQALSYIGFVGWDEYADWSVTACGRDSVESGFILQNNGYVRHTAARNH